MAMALRTSPDKNNNGIIGDAGDADPDNYPECHGAGIQGVTVYLVDCQSGNPLPGYMTVTDAGGFYLFDNLDAGTPTVSSLT